MAWINQWEMWLSIAVAVGLLAALAMRFAATDLIAVCGLGVLVLAGDLFDSDKLPTPTDAVMGFGNAGLVTIAFLFAVVTGMERTGGTALATGWLLDQARSLRGAQLRMLIPVAFVSGFLNNTPLVAALLPVIDDLSKRLRVSASRLLLPLSYAAIMGGMCTLMGTSTNLVVREKYYEYTQREAVAQTAELQVARPPAGAEPLDVAEMAPGAATLGFFAPAIVGIPATVLGLIYIIVFSGTLIPERKAAVSLSDDPRKYTVEMRVDPDGVLVGKTLSDAALRSLPGLYVAEIQRQDGRIEPAKPEALLRPEDTLILVGALDSVVDLRKIRGLSTPDDQSRKLAVPAWRRTLVEAVVSSQCSLVGKTIREGRFRSNYNAAVVAVARGGKRLEGKIGDVRIEVGDVLLLEASPSFMHRQRGSGDFYLVSKVEGGHVRRHERAWISLLVVLAMVLSAATGVLEILTAALVATLLMIGLRCCTTNEARRSVDWSVLIVIGAAMGIGTAMDKSGAATAIAGGLLKLGGGSQLGTLVAIYLATVVCTELVTNTAAAIIMFHIAWQSASTLGMQKEPLVIAVMIAASASFLTPFGYQTNTMVYGVGGYRLKDYLVFGLPLSLLVGATAVVMLTWRYGLL
ncbi:MAG: SLC13 family permease [Planctomycetota bacterium]